MENNYEKEFWETIDLLITDCKIVIDRKKGSTHPRYPHIIYPVDYGYLESSKSMDGGGIDVWLGTGYADKADAVIITVDILKKDSEIKILIGCGEKEKSEILKFHNNSFYMKGILIRR